MICGREESELVAPHTLCFVKYKLIFRKTPSEDVKLMINQSVVFRDRETEIQRSIY